MTDIAETLPSIASDVLLAQLTERADHVVAQLRTTDIMGGVVEDWQTTGGDPTTGIATATYGGAAVQIHADNPTEAEYYSRGIEWAMTRRINITDLVGS